MEIEKKMEDLGRAFEEFKKINDAKLKEVETKGQANALTEEKLQKANDHISTLESEIKEIKAAFSRTQQGENKEQKETKEALERKEALSKYLRRGIESKAMSVDSDADGGYLVTPEMSSEIVKKVYETSPMRQISSVQTISTDALEILEDLDEAAVGWVGELSSRPETGTPQLNKIVIPVHELYAQPKASQKLLDDAAVNVEAWLSEKVSDKFARTEAEAFVKGDGVNKPKGFLSYAEGTGFGQVEAMETSTSLTIKPDDLINLSYKLKGFYKNGAQWLMKRETIALLRTFKDLQNRYLWAPGLDGASASTFLGFEIMEANDLVTGVGAAAGDKPIAFGNFKAGYQIVDRIGIRVIRDVYTAKPNVLFYTTKRVGGGVKNFEAIKVLKVKA